MMKLFADLCVCVYVCVCGVNKEKAPCPTLPLPPPPLPHNIYIFTGDCSFQHKHKWAITTSLAHYEASILSVECLLYKPET